MDYNNSTSTSGIFTHFTTTIVPEITREIVKNASRVTFSWYDYILFTVMLVFSAIIGIYFGCFGSKQATTKEYLMGGKTMKVIPIAVSLVASHTSGITLLALPADVYRYGAAYWLGTFSMVLLCLITIYVYLPVFFNLQITSTYEYLERRFDNRTRLLASFLFALSVLLYLPIVVYIPALAFSAATGINVHLITPVVCSICIFYTTIGGLKAVVWTDTLQFTVTVGAVATVFVLGVKSAGGFGAVWDKAVEGGRLDIFDFGLDPTQRDGFWIILIGLTTHWIGHTSVNQSCVQKFLAVPTLKDATWAVIYFGIGMSVIKTVSVLTGLVMYSKYASCDPFTTKEVTRNDQLLPYYIMDVAKNVPGLSGLFIAGVFSAALSTLSATLNCLAGTIYEDFVHKLIGKDVSEKTASNILKVIVVVTGVLSTAMVLLVEKMGGLLPLAISLQGVTNGSLLGMFTLGVLFPRANSKGAFYGSLAGLLFMSGIAFPAKYFQSQGMMKYPHKPLSTDGCSHEFVNGNGTFTNGLDSYRSNMTELFAEVATTKNFHNMEWSNNNKSTPSGPAQPPYQPPAIFRISYYYYTLLGAIISMIVGLIISYSTRHDDKPIDRNLISPVMHFLLPKSATLKQSLPLDQYYSVDDALKVVTNHK